MSGKPGCRLGEALDLNLDGLLSKKLGDKLVLQALWAKGQVAVPAPAM